MPGISTRRWLIAAVMLAAAVLSGQASQIPAAAVAMDTGSWTNAVAWGANFNGQVGDGTTSERTNAVGVVQSQQLGFTRVAAGWNHSLTVAADGTAWAWGANHHGQLGDGTNTTRTSPVRVAGLTNVVDVTAGLDHSLAIMADGSVWTWGANSLGQLGDGTKIEKWTPVKVPGISNAVKASGAQSHYSVLRADGTVWGWGFGHSGQLGTGHRGDSLIPVRASNIDNVVDVAVGGVFTLAVRSDGTTWVWGASLSPGADSLTPQKIPSISGATKVAGGTDHALVLRSDGTVWAWGHNNFGQLGDGSTTPRPAPVRVAGLTGIVQVTGGNSTSAAVRSDGTAWTWGLNISGTLGDGTHNTRLVPVRVTNLTGVVQVATSAHSSHMLAVRAAPRPGFLFELSAESGSIFAGSTVTVTLTVRPLNGFTGSLRLTVASLPRGVTSSLGLKTIVGAGDSIDVTFTADGNPRIGSVTLTFTGQTILGAVPASTSTADYDLHVETFS